MPLLAHAQDANVRIADLQARIAQLEEQVRRLTGLIEDSQYAQRQTDQRLDKLLADLDARLPGVEGGAAPGAAPAPTTAPSATAPGIAAPATGGLAPGPSTLGTLSNETVANLPPPPPAPLEADLSTARAGIDSGLARVKAGDWSGAEAIFSRVLATAPDDPLAPTAAYWLAETYYARKEWPSAAAAFARNVQTFGTDAPRAADNVLKLGMSLARLGEKQKACAAFAEFDRSFAAGSTAAIRQTAQREKGNAGCT